MGLPRLAGYLSKLLEDDPECRERLVVATP